MTILILGFFESKLSANENPSCSFIEAPFQEDCITEDYIFLNNLENLKLHHDILLLEMRGSYHPVRSLQKIENQWLVTFNGYCPQMHPLCECGQCHNTQCRYYIKYCPRERKHRKRSRDQEFE